MARSHRPFLTEKQTPVRYWKIGYNHTLWYRDFVRVTLNYGYTAEGNKVSLDGLYPSKEKAIAAQLELLRNQVARADLFLETSKESLRKYEAITTFEEEPAQW